MAKIVGTGAATCATFLSDIARNPFSEREYFAWAQGYMSGILMRAPPGKDENLDLTPPGFPVKDQLGFFRDFCAEHEQNDFADAAAQLYQRLREFAPKCGNEARSRSRRSSGVGQESHPMIAHRMARV